MTHQGLRTVTKAFCIAFIGTLANGARAGVPALTAVPDSLPPAVQGGLAQERAQCQAAYASFKAAADSFNAKKAEDQSDAEAGSVERLRDVYVHRANAYNEEVRRDLLAKKLGWNPDRIRRLGYDPNEIEELEMHALAEKLGWSDEKRARLDGEVKKLRIFDKGQMDKATVADIWRGIEARSKSEVLAREARAGSGVSMGPGAGAQDKELQDCAVFALANATGQPYSVVAARANELLASAGWRSEDERAHPQRVIEQSGLNGGEVLMLAEAFGQGEAVSPVDFEKTLGEGRPIMVDVYPGNWDGDLRHSHEVVLTRTFQHEGKTWYVVSDSLKGPQRQLFLSSDELSDVIRDTGVAYRTEQGRTPVLLRGTESP